MRDRVVKSLGYILITGGFLFGSYFSVVETEQVDWRIVLPALLVGLAGVAAVRLAEHGHKTASDRVRASMGKLEEALARIVDNITRLDAEKDGLDVYAVHHRIDELFMTDLDSFVDNRETIGHAFGLQTYADVMTQFATGERYLNRAWSASTDGYIDEVKTCLTRARDQFTQALELLSRHTGPTGDRSR